MIRTLVTPDKNVVSFDIPEEYVGKKIEVIAFTLEEGLPNYEKISKTTNFTVLKIKHKSYQFNRDEANER